MARAFAGDYLVTEYYRKRLREIAGVLRDLPNEREFKGVDDERLVDHFLKQAIGSNREGGFELHPLQEVNSPSSRSVESEPALQIGGTETTVSIQVVKLPLMPFRSNSDALNVRAGQGWPQGTGIEMAASFRWQDQTVEIRGQKSDIGRLVRTAEHMMTLINADIERHTPDFRRQVLALVQEHRHRIAQDLADVEQTRRELGIEGDLPGMAPENPATVAVHDLYFENRRLRSKRHLVEASSPETQVLHVGWDYDEQPLGYVPIGDGVIYVRETEGYAMVPSAGEPPLRAIPAPLGNERYRVREDTVGGGAMIVLVLPRGYTLTDPAPIPSEAKAFQDRVALFWRSTSDSQPLETVWTLIPMSRELQEEIEQLNSGAAPELLSGDELSSSIVIDRHETSEISKSQNSSPITIFYSYSHKDERYRERLETHLTLLKRERLITEWHDRRILAGTEWKGQIDEHLAQAQIVLLLVSPDFLASNYCYDREMSKALERHDEGKATVIPVILRSVDWHGAPFGKLQALPKDGKPITEWRRQDTGWTDVAKGIRRAVEELTR